MFNPDQRADPPRVEDTGKRDEPTTCGKAMCRDVPLLLDTIDELHSRIRALDPQGKTTSEEGGW